MITTKQTSPKMRWVGLGGQTVENSRRPACKLNFDFDRIEHKAWTKELQVFSLVYWEVRLSRISEIINVLNQLRSTSTSSSVIVWIRFVMKRTCVSDWLSISSAEVIFKVKCCQSIVLQVLSVETDRPAWGCWLQPWCEGCQQLLVSCILPLLYGIAMLKMSANKV